MNNNHKQNFSGNQNNSSKENDFFIPIPNRQHELLDKPSCNFSLYSPRMIKWRHNKDELKADTGMMTLLEEKSAELFKNISAEIKRKQERQAAYIESLKQMGIKTFTFRAKTVSPFITGLGSGHPTETGMILDRNLGIPYIPASSIKGVMRLSYAINIANGRKEVSEEELEMYFGTDGGSDDKKRYRGQLVFLDAYPVGEVKLKVDIMNPHFSKYYDGTNKMPVETESPMPIKFLTVKEGMQFVFNCAFFQIDSDKTLTKENEKEIEDMFQSAFTKVGFGGKTAIGYGRFEKIDNDKNFNQKQTPAPVVKIENLSAGEYDAVIINKDKKRSSIYFEIGVQKAKAVQYNCKQKLLMQYQKKDKVKISIDGSKDKECNYVVKEIIHKL